MTKFNLKWVIIALTLISISAFWQCDESSNPVSQNNEYLPGSWSWVIWEHPDLNWNHDGHPYESTNFIVFSLSSSDSAKRQMSDYAEESLVFLKNAFEFNSVQEMGITQKLDVYAKHYYLWWGARAYDEGIIVDAIDSDAFQTRYRNDLMIYKGTLKHELTHIIQQRFVAGREIPIWFNEGLCEYLATPELGLHIATACGDPILTVTQLDAWRSKGFENPITIEKWSDYPLIRTETYWQFYPMFQLAVAYLVDGSGLNRSILDIKGILIDIQNGIDFQTTFEQRMGISVDDYRDNFYEWMYDFLS